MARLTVHMVANAHIDPVWMWTWPAGVDEAINTCRTACDLLEAYPELVITRGEAWVYEQIRTLAPDVFACIRRHVAAGRWSVVNGWWVQADTNMSSAQTLRKQGEIGRAWFREHLGLDVTVAYEVDTFGHPATLPAILKATGFDAFIWGRPLGDVQPLPAELFTWRAPTGEAILSARIPVSYCARGIHDLERHLEAAVATANREVGHAVCFYGVGDHGGGPSREQIEWIRAHRRYRPDVELVFSSPQRFFQAVREANVTLPVYEGELQWVSPGCYSAVHETKQQFHEAETLLAQAEGLVERFGDLAPRGAAEQLRQAWTHVCFNSFHDVLPGSSIEPAYSDARDDLGCAKRTARQIITHVTRRRTFDIGSCERQRVILHNISNRPFRGLVETEPYLGHLSYAIPVRYVADGRELPIQRTAGHAAEQKMFRYLVPVALGPFERQVIEVHHDRPSEAAPPTVAWARIQTGDGGCAEEATGACAAIENNSIRVRTGPSGIESICLLDEEDREFLNIEGIQIASFVDMSDSWGHGVEGAVFGNDLLGTFTTTEWKTIETGPLRASVSADLRLQHSRILWQVSLHAGEPIVRMRLRVYYQGQHEIVKLLIPPDFAPSTRVDGIPGGRLERPMNRREYPIRNHVSVYNEDAALSVVTRDAFAADVQPDGTIRLTLLRSPNFCHNFNFPEALPDEHVYPLMSQGEHVYEIALLPRAWYDPAAVDDEADRQAKPVWMSENTVGMPPRHYGDL